MEPTVSSDPSMKERRPVSTADTDQSGFQVSGWKSDMERQSFWLHLKRPCGVHMYTAGGLYGYSSGNWRRPMKMPPSYGVPLGASSTKYHLRMLEGSGRAVMCGGGSREMLRNSFRRRSVLVLEAMVNESWKEAAGARDWGGCRTWSARYGCKDECLIMQTWKASKRMRHNYESS